MIITRAKNDTRLRSAQPQFELRLQHWEASRRSQTPHRRGRQLRSPDRRAVAASALHFRCRQTRLVESVRPTSPMPAPPELATSKTDPRKSNTRQTFAPNDRFNLTLECRVVDLQQQSIAGPARRSQPPPNLRPGAQRERAPVLDASMPSASELPHLRSPQIAAKLH